MQIAVVDLGIGNLRSVEQALHKVAPDADVRVTADASIVDSADRIVLPGQGAIGTWFSALRERDLENKIKAAIQQKPLLGICVGMQALFSYCEEDGGMPGLAAYDGSVRHFSNFHADRDHSQAKLKIPQMGWNQVAQTQEHSLWHGIEDHSHFYFVHSYCANLNEGGDEKVICGVAEYGHEFIAAVASENIFAVQFHPEKSHKDGLQLLKNFTQWNGNG